ncbi:MAG: TorF family putative porin [Thalassolituus oleivorans]|uniref:TorF family putative porin n=1 Tax=Thalassolituus oleivorans TaxID=187493 RepID=UPI001B4672EC|nr:TorF family putative porin [Thalassolituus oleivorans]MBQ0728568.1 TorF family putative porin [Thalassolituus oleivorans]MBQ0780835.1 TorF family putative porin [Thalassolituus oleivorans]
MKKLTKAIALAGVMTAGMTAATSTFAEEVEVSASATVASMYLWRGQDLGNGAAAVSGDLTASIAGAYAGVWTSSGDSNAGNEYDLYIGYGGEVEDFSYDLSVWTYSYPGAGDEGNTFDLTDAILSLGYMGASFSYYYPLSSNPSDYSYMTLGYGMDAFSATVGMTSSDDDTDYTHLDLSYAYNDSLAFTLSKVVDQETENAVDDDVRLVVSYSLPISM